MADSPKPRGAPIGVAPHYRSVAVRGLRYDGDELVVDVQGEDFAFARVVFQNPAGFRVLDERDLGELWPEFSVPRGWLWEVESGGWMDLERRRALFNSPEFLAPLREFLVVDEKCISVLCAEPPRIVDAGRGAQ